MIPFTPGHDSAPVLRPQTITQSIPVEKYFKRVRRQWQVYIRTELALVRVQPIAPSPFYSCELFKK
jgi:hypothetical protein